MGDTRHRVVPNTIVANAADDGSGFTSADITDDHVFHQSAFPKRATFRSRSAVVLHHHIGFATGESPRARSHRTGRDGHSKVNLVPGNSMGAISVLPVESERDRYEGKSRRNGRRRRSSGVESAESIDNASSLVRVIEMLQSLGLSIEDAGRVVQRRPDLLQIDVENDLKSLKSFLAGTIMRMDSDYLVGKVIRNAPGVFKRTKSIAGKEEIAMRLSFLEEEIGIPAGVPMADLVSKRPHMMWMDLNNARSVVEWLSVKVGIEQRNVLAVLKKMPHIMLSRVESLEENLNFIVDVLGLDKDVQRGRFVIRYPQVLCLRVETMMKRVDYFKSLGVAQPNDVKNIVEATPEVLEESIDLGLKKKVSVLHKWGLGSAEDIKRILTKAPGIFNTDLSEHFNWLKSIGLSDEQIVEQVRSLPAVLIYSIPTNLEPKWLYMQQVIKGSTEDLVQVPLFFAYNLEQRVMPRVAFVRSKRLKTDISIAQILNGTDKQFCKSLGFNYEEFRVFEQTGGSLLFHTPMM